MRGWGLRNAAGEAFGNREVGQDLAVFIGPFLRRGFLLDRRAWLTIVGRRFPSQFEVG